MDCPQFWCKFFLHLPERQIPLPTLDAWLQRSANMTIEIDVFDDMEPIMNTPRYQSVQQYRTEMLSLLSHHLPRWKRLNVRLTNILTQMLLNIDFSSAQSLDNIGLSFFGGRADINRGLLVALERVPNFHSFEFRPPSTSDLSVLLGDPGFEFLRRLKRLEIPFDLFVEEMLDIVRRCCEVQWIRTVVKWMTGDPLSMASSEKLRILDITFHEVDHRTLAHLHVPNLKVLFVRCKDGGGYEVTEAISEFIVGNRRPSLQILRVVDVRVGPVDELVCNGGLRRIPIVEIHVEVPRYDTNDKFVSLLSESFDRWKECDNRFRKRLGDDKRSWSVGWVEAKVFRQNQESLPVDILNEIDIGLLI